MLLSYLVLTHFSERHRRGIGMPFLFRGEGIRIQKTSTGFCTFTAAWPVANSRCCYSQLHHNTTSVICLHVFLTFLIRSTDLRDSRIIVPWAKRSNLSGNNANQRLWLNQNQSFSFHTLKLLSCAKEDSFLVVSGNGSPFGNSAVQVFSCIPISTMVLTSP